MVIEKCPKRRAVNKDVGTPTEEVEPGHAALSITTTTIREIRISIYAGGGPWCWSKAWVPIAALPVRSFRLLHANKNILGVVEVILVDRVVLNRRAMKPSGGGGFDQHASASRNGLTVPTIKVMVSSPCPHVLDIGRG